MKSLVLIVFVIATVGAFRYDGYHLIQIGPLHDVDKVHSVLALADDDERVKQVILMNEHVLASQSIDLAVSPHSLTRIFEFLKQNEFPFVVTNRDLQRSFDESMAANENELTKWRRSGSKAAPTAYLRYDEQVSWVTSAAESSTIASLISIGLSYEGREVVGIAINEGRNDLPVVWIDANTHAREWISSASTLYVIDQILSGTSEDAIRMRTDYRWYIIPNVNPDGYEYTWTRDRAWRKTRSANPGAVCLGTDPNRNWDENWGGPGTSSLPCADTYAGPSAFSEVEIRNVRDFLSTIADQTNVVITIHSYSQLLLVPWGGYDYKPDDYDEMMRVGNLAAEAIYNVNGLTFQVGTPPDLIYAAAGGSFDWIKAKLNVTYTYGPELRPLTADEGGFNIPASNIAPSGAELFAGIVAIVTNAQHKISS